MFEKWKLDSQKSKSAEAFQRLTAAKAHADEIFAAGEALQPGIEAAFLQFFACERTGGSQDRLRELGAQISAETRRTRWAARSRKESA